MSRYKVFQNEIPGRMSYLRSVYNNFENFRKIKFQWERIFKKPMAFCEFSLNFQSENGFELTKDRRIEMRGPFQYIEKNVLTPVPSTCSFVMYLLELVHSS